MSRTKKHQKNQNLLFPIEAAKETGEDTHLFLPRSEVKHRFCVARKEDLTHGQQPLPPYIKFLFVPVDLRDEALCEGTRLGRLFLLLLLLFERL